MVVAPSLDAEAAVKAFKAKHKVGDEIAYVSEAGATAKAYGVRGYPAAFVVGRDGRIVYKGHPMAPDFEQAIENALK